MVCNCKHNCLICQRKIFFLEKLAKVFGIEMFQLFNFSHNDSRENLEQDLIALIKHSSDEDLRLISKLVNSILK